MRRVAIVGAGYISAIHADALATISGVSLVAAVDQNREAAERLARRHGVGAVYTNIEALIASRSVDAAHVAVPPPLHRAVAQPLLQAGIDVLLEKPLAANGTDAEALAAIEAIEGAGRLGVNQNFVHHPAHLRLKAALSKIGPIEHVHLLYNVPLRQIAARQFGHWMFAEPKNILLEQAVHPLSQILDLIGAVEEVSALAGPGVDIGRATLFRPTWQVQLRGRHASADLQFAVGRDFPFWRIDVVGTDGVASADILANRMVVLTRSRYPDFSDVAIGGLSTALQTAVQGVGSVARYAGSLVKVTGRSDPFFLSMRNSIAAFHAGYPAGTPRLDGRFGANLVSLCERMAAVVGGATVEAPPLLPSAETPVQADIALLGGTGFIGGHLTRELAARGLKLSILARNIDALPAEYHVPNITLVRGDVHDRDTICRAIGSAKMVVNLAQGAGGANDEEIVANISSAAATVTECCIELGVERLVHLSTIAALHLGSPSRAITAATPTDPKLDLRAVYARGKALAEHAVLGKAQGSALSVVILRPGIVVGTGGLPFHSGVGFFNNEQHCLGWDDGRHPLPFVLAEDVATATAAALTAPGAVGRTLNIVGDVRLTARQYIEALGQAMRRPLRFHGNAPWKLAALEAGKWVLKQAVGRRDAVRPTYWDIKSRGLSAPFDTTTEKALLDWTPISDRSVFIERAMAPFARQA